MRRSDSRSRPHPGRRAWLGGLGAAALGAIATRQPLAQAAMPAIEQPAAPTPQAFMERAFAMRRLAERNGDQPYGAVVIKDGVIVAEAPSRVVSNGDPTAHAETEAVRDAARRLGTRNLAGCVMYSSSRPCPMCQGAAVWGGIARLYYGADITDGGPPRLSGC